MPSDTPERPRKAWLIMDERALTEGENNACVMEAMTSDLYTLDLVIERRDRAWPGYPIFESEETGERNPVNGAPIFSGGHHVA